VIKIKKKNLIFPTDLTSRDTISLSEVVVSGETKMTLPSPQQQAILALSLIDIDKLTPHKTKKSVMISTLRNKHTYMVENPYYTHDEMKNIAQALNLPITGNRKDLYDRIMNELRLAGRIKT
jgi:hypothetical protein